MNSVVPNLRESSSKLITPKGETTLFLTNMSKGNLMVPKSITWDQVNLPEKWTLEEAVPIKKEDSRSIEEIFEHKDGHVEIAFSRSRSVIVTPDRRSFSGLSNRGS